MTAPQPFSTWLAESGRVPDGLELPEEASPVGVRLTLLRALATYPLSLKALPLFRALDELAAQHSRETGTPLLARVRAEPLGLDSRRGFAGVVGGAA